MTCDEAKERAVIFRAALQTLVDAAHPLSDRYHLEKVVSGCKVVLESYPFDSEALRVLRRMAEEGREVDGRVL